jgi:hypothetical protein
MAPRAENSPGHSELNDFLFAFIGEEKSGLKLTVLSALSAFARLGLDPWKEAGRLSKLPKEAAINALAAMIADLPSGDWGLSDSRTIAMRVVNFFPRSGSLSARSPAGSGIEYQDAKSDARKYLVWFLLAAAIAVVISRLFGN